MEQWGTGKLPEELVLVVAGLSARLEDAAESGGATPRAVDTSCLELELDVATAPNRLEGPESCGAAAPRAMGNKPLEPELDIAGAQV
jgi:hypothetical protein